MISKNVSPKVRFNVAPTPISNFVSAMEKYNCSVMLRLGTGTYNAKSVIGVLASCFSSIDEFEIVCDGIDEKIAMQEAERFLK